MSERFTICEDVPGVLRQCGFVAYVNDAEHADDPICGASVSWHQSLPDAERTCHSLNVAHANFAARAALSLVKEDAGK